MSTVVWAVIAVLVLVLLAAIVISNVGKGNQAIGECAAKGGVCADSCSDLTDGRQYAGNSMFRCGTGQTCCIPMGR